MAVISVSDLHKRYVDTHAVRGVSFEISEGEVFALLGPNGAGKTTTVEILEGHRDRSSGSVSVLGYDPATGGSEMRERIGIVLQSGSIDPLLTVREVISMYHDIYPRRRPVDEVIELVGLEEKADTRVKTLSGGQQRRLDLAVGIVGDPDLIFMDEPTTGFDPSARRRAWGLVSDLGALGKTILLTTHYMDEAQALADRVAVISDGEIVASGRPDTLGSRATGHTRIVFAARDVSDLPSLAGTVAVTADTVEVVTTEPTVALHALTTWAVNRGLELEGLEVARPTLEDVYLELTAEGADE